MKVKGCVKSITQVKFGEFVKHKTRTTSSKELYVLELEFIYYLLTFTYMPMYVYKLSIDKNRYIGFYTMRNRIMPMVNTLLSNLCTFIIYVVFRCDNVEVLLLKF